MAALQEGPRRGHQRGQQLRKHKRSSPVQSASSGERDAAQQVASHVAPKPSQKCSISQLLARLNGEIPRCFAFSERRELLAKVAQDFGYKQDRPHRHWQKLGDSAAGLTMSVPSARARLLFHVRQVPAIEAQDPRCKLARLSTKSDVIIVYRQVPLDAIDSMSRGRGVGKSIRCKGKSSKAADTYGFVPFLQTNSPTIFSDSLQQIGEGGFRIFCESDQLASNVSETLDGTQNGKCVTVTFRALSTYGKEHAEDIATFDLKRKDGMPKDCQFQNFNLKYLSSTPRGCVVYTGGEQFNIHTLLIGVAVGLDVDQKALPLVSDFDALLYGVKHEDDVHGMVVPRELREMALKALAGAGPLMQQANASCEWNWHQAWATALSNVQEPEDAEGIGLGDQTTLKVTRKIIEEVSYCGAHQHSTEAFNLKFPQDIRQEDDFLVFAPSIDVEHGRQWEYLRGGELANFLITNFGIEESFHTVIHPLWPIIDSWDGIGFRKVWCHLREDQERIWGKEVVAEVDRYCQLFSEGLRPGQPAQQLSGGQASKLKTLLARNERLERENEGLRQENDRLRSEAALLQKRIISLEALPERQPALISSPVQRNSCASSPAQMSERSPASVATPIRKKTRSGSSPAGQQGRPWK